MTTASAARIKSAGSRPSKAAVTVDVSSRTLRRLADLFQQLADESRLKILLALAQDGPLCVSDLCQLLAQSQPAVSHHLTLLRMSGLVQFQRRGKQNFYRVDSSTAHDLLQLFFQEIGCSDRPFDCSELSLLFSSRLNGRS